MTHLGSAISHYQQLGIQDTRVLIPDDRQQHLIDFFQKLDRMMTGLPLRVIVKNLQPKNTTGDGNLSETDGKRLWFDWRILRERMRTETRLGINYSEVAHTYYGDPRYDRDVTDMKQAANILLDCRDETLFATTYPSIIPYFVSMVQERVIKDRDLKNCADVWPLLYGRKYLPYPVRFTSARSLNPKWVKDACTVIDNFISLPPVRANIKEMLTLTKLLQDLLESSHVVVKAEEKTWSFYNPGGGRLIRGTRKVEGDIDEDVFRRIKITIDKDRLKLKKRIKLVHRGSKGYTTRESGSSSGTKIDEFSDAIHLDIEEIEGHGYQEFTTETKYVDHPTSSKKDVEVSNHTLPEVDEEFATEYGGSSGLDVSGGGPGGAGGSNFTAVELLEEDASDQEFVNYVWMDDPVDDDWAKGNYRLNKFREVLTNDTVKDIVRSLEAEVLFDTDQLNRAGWEGCGAVTAELRNIRNGFDRELQLAARALKSRYGVGKRGSVSMKASMKAERLPTTDIFRCSKAYLASRKLEVEVVLLIDASGSMHGTIQQAMKAQWIIGSVFEKRGAKVTIIPFNNMARDPLKGRDDKFSDKIYPYATACGGTQPQGALSKTMEIFDKCGSRFKMVFILTDGAWNRADWAHKLIDQMNHRGVLTTLVFMGGSERDMATVKASKYHHCKEGLRINGVAQLLPEMRKTFFKAFNKAIIRTLRRYS